MTDRYSTLTVVLEKPMRSDEAEALIAAIGMMRCVLTVRGDVEDPGEYATEMRVRQEFIEKIWSIVGLKS
jgi:hypothetical protein